MAVDKTTSSKKGFAQGEKNEKEYELCLKDDGVFF